MLLLFSNLDSIAHFACSDNDHKDDTDDDDDDVPNIVDRQNKFLYYYMNFPEKVRLTIGHQFSDMIKFCTFKGRDCLTGWDLQGKDPSDSNLLLNGIVHFMWEGGWGPSTSLQYL